MSAAVSTSTTTSIEAYQIRKIYSIGNALGMVNRDDDEDTLHALIGSLTGKASVKTLTKAEANAVIAELMQRQGDAPAPHRQPSRSKKQAVPGGATQSQQRKIWALMYNLTEYDAEPSTASLGDRLCGIIRRELKVTAYPGSPFVWLDFKAANRLIEILKGYIATAKRKRDGNG